MTKRTASARTAARTASARPLAAAVLAAGEGKRFKSALPKVLHELGGRPMLAGILDTVGSLKPARTVVVVGRGAETVRAAFEGRGIEFAHQARQLGTGDAARTADDALGEFDGDVLLVPGDHPLLSARSLRGLLGRHRKARAAATIMTASFGNPSGYGRIVRDDEGAIRSIVEHRDATAAQRSITEWNTSVYVFDRAALRSALTKVDRRNKQAEYYLTDVIKVLADKGERIASFETDEPADTMGVNSRAQLAEAAAHQRASINRALMDSGVTIVDPTLTFVDAGVKVGRDTVLHPMTFLAGSTVVGAGCEIGPAVRARDSRIEDGAHVMFAVLQEARVGANASVGPYSFLRPGTRLRRGAKVGSYVELKNSVVGEGSKVPHLSYVGDAIVGRDVNIGAGTITVNYDPETKVKSQTTIGDGAKIGSDTMLIAPVNVGKGAVTGAGSVVTKDVPADTVVVGAPARALRARKRKKSDDEGGKR